MALKKAIVIGGGLSGLTAAYRLQTDMPELNTILLEAKDYLGGRVLTTQFGGEAGASIFGSHYKSLFNLAREINVEIESISLENASNMTYYWSATKEWVNQKDWAAWKNNPLPPELRKISPIMLFPYYASKMTAPPLDQIFENPSIKKLCGQSLLQFLQIQKVPTEALPFIQSYFEINSDLSQTSAFYSLLKIWQRPKNFDTSLSYIKSGSQTLCTHLMDRLKHIYYGQRVIRVEKKGKQFEVVTEKGMTYEADYLIFAIPGNPMGNITLIPQLEGMQKEAFAQLCYSPAIIVFYKALSPFWEKDQLPLSMWSDTDINVGSAVYEKETRQNPVSGSKIWGIQLTIIGNRALHLYSMQKKGIPIHKQCLTILEEIRPATRGCLEHVQTIDWGNDPNELGGFSYYPPNENIPEYLKNMAKPSFGRYFAGEHTEFLHKGLDAAVFSGIRVAKELIQDYKSYH